MRKSALLEIGGFPSGIASGEDLLTWARLAVRFPVSYSMKSLATFQLGDTAQGDGVLRRSPETGDGVGQGLAELLAVCPHELVPGLRRYLAHWYKMRASAFLRAPDLRKSVLSSWLRSLGFHWMQPKLWLYLPLMVVPHRIRIFIVKYILGWS